MSSWIPGERQCPAVKGYYCVFHALLCFIRLATKGLFHFSAVILFLLHDMFLILITEFAVGRNFSSDLLFVLRTQDNIQVRLKLLYVTVYQEAHLQFSFLWLC